MIFYVFCFGIHNKLYYELIQPDGTESRPDTESELEEAENPDKVTKTICCVTKH